MTSGLRRYLLELALLQGRQSLSRDALFRIAKGPAISLDPRLHRTEELPLPVGEVYAREFRLAPRASEGVQGGPPGGFTGIGGRPSQISPIAER
jgi:hypothetical protein